MCGVAGYSGIGTSPWFRTMLVRVMGEEIQKRGNHAWGYAGHTGVKTIARRGLGGWGNAPWDECARAADAESLILHARYGTHGARDDRDNAHPFTVRRNGQIVLHGIHNGVLSGTEASAKRHGRPHTVDSRELFELLADGKHAEAEEKLTGYGVILWVVPRSEIIRAIRLTSDADLVIARLESGGLMWSSTKSGLEAVSGRSGLKIAEYLPDIRPGIVHGIYHGRLKPLPDEPGIRLQRAATWSWDAYGTDEADYADSGAYSERIGGQRITYGSHAIRVDETFGARGPRQSYYRYDDWGKTWKYLDNHVVVKDECGWYYHDADGYRTYAAYHAENYCEHGKSPVEDCPVCDDTGDSSGPDTIPDMCEHGVSGDAECEQCLSELDSYCIINSDQETG